MVWLPTPRVDYAYHSSCWLNRTSRTTLLSHEWTPHAQRTHATFLTVKSSTSISIKGFIVLIHPYCKRRSAQLDLSRCTATRPCACRNQSLQDSRTAAEGASFVIQHLQNSAAKKGFAVVWMRSYVGKDNNSAKWA